MSALAIVGVHGLVSHSARSRTKEFAIRIALGENRRQILFRSLSGAARAGLPGVLIGLLLSRAVVKVLQSKLFGVAAADPIALAASFVIMMCAAMLASSLAARRVFQIEPVAALREE